MSQWIRLWEGMTTDPKWRVVKARAMCNVSMVSIGDIVSVFVHMLNSADKNGDLDTWCDEDVAAALEYKVELVCAIREAMQGKVLDGNHLKSWDKRQPNENNLSTKRVRAFRERRNRSKPSETPEEKRLERSIELSSKVLSPKKFGQRALSEKMEFEKEEFEQFWTAFGHKQQRKRAEEVFANAVAKTTIETILAGVKRYHETRPPWQQVTLAASWLNGERWMDEALETGQSDNGQKTRSGQKSDNGQSDKPNGHATTSPVFVQMDTPQWNAWVDVYQKLHGKPPPKTTRRGTIDRGWYFPSEYPPGESTDRIATD